MEASTGAREEPRGSQDADEGSSSCVQHLAGIVERLLDDGEQALDLFLRMQLLAENKRADRATISALQQQVADLQADKATDRRTIDALRVLVAEKERLLQEVQMGGAPNPPLKSALPPAGAKRPPKTVTFAPLPAVAVGVDGPGKRKRCEPLHTARVCKACCVQFGDEAELRAHACPRAQAKRYACPAAGCGKVFATLSSRKRHEGSHAALLLVTAETALEAPARAGGDSAGHPMARRPRRN
ncbi:uncharacterized protein LOC129600703 [Paramacrobiotus metropolitanus]|uniref:uncharacterized protein LOC129600703 n=1 Tax=Paramacrobiotus metropolitanus TaxID=2943436 RepID=UPI0024461077|nr:uncharacterized protein LOC129600703 [Paramacrobiotus metropolitanus]